MYRSVFALVVTAIVAGCSSAEKEATTETEAPASQDVEYPDSPDVGVAHHELALGGAAWRAPGYRHVIGAKAPSYTVAATEAGRQEDAAEQQQASSSDGDGADYSSRDEAPAERSKEKRRARELWRKLCDPTKTMSDAEREEFQRLRRQYAMPQELTDECAPRK